jgi:uncharacterized membrane protein
MNYPWHLYTMAALYIIAGIMHFIKPKIYLRIMPSYLPKHKLLVYLSGVIEIILGIGICAPFFKNLALISIIGMLLAFLLVHFFMLNNEKASAGLPKWLLVLRILIQFLLMYWAYSYLKL